MTLDDYKKECSAMLEAMPKGTGSRERYYQALGLAKLYELAADQPYEENEPFFDHWWSLPVEDELKQEILRNVKAV